MLHLANKKAWLAVYARESFIGSNTFGEWDSNGVYKVYSYGYHFPIYAYKQGIWYKNTDKYSVSTSKHQSQLHHETDCTPLNTEEIKAL